MTGSRHLSDQVGAARFLVLCQLTDLQTAVADAWREYITSGGQLSGCRGPLSDAGRAINMLLNDENLSTASEQGRGDGG